MFGGQPRFPQFRPTAKRPLRCWKCLQELQFFADPKFATGKEGTGLYSSWRPSLVGWRPSLLVRHDSDGGSPLGQAIPVTRGGKNSDGSGGVLCHCHHVLHELRT